MKRAAVILCGGLSRRMKSPKALLPFGTVNLLKYQAERFSAVFDKVYISVSAQIRGLIDEEDFDGCRIIEDVYEAIGPMGGLYSCLKNSGEEILFFTSVDSPFTDTHLAGCLYDTLKKNPGKTACTIKDINGRLQPLFCAYSKKALAEIEELTEQKDFRLKNIFSDKTTVVFDGIFPDEQFFNMNDPASYYYALKKLSLRQGVNFAARPFLAAEVSRAFAVSFSAVSGTGKTTYLEKLIPLLKEKGLRITVIKHDAHGFEVDKPGKDSYRLRAAGADRVILSSAQKTFSVCVHPEGGPELSEITASVNDSDIILTEGYKFEDLPKVCLLRKGYSEKPAGSRKNIIAYAADFDYKADVPVFDLNNPADMADFLLKCCKGRRESLPV